MTAWTVQCGYAAYYANTITVEAVTLDEALDKAIVAANDDPNWRSLDHCGPTFVDAIAEGIDADPWLDHRSAIPIPEGFTEQGAPPAIAVTLTGGTVTDIAVENGPARVIVRDYNTDGADPASLETDETGAPYRRTDWTTVLPPRGG